ncbi:DUF3156 family protein [Vibrio sp. E150_011]
MRAKNNAFKVAKSALYNNALAFSPYWGGAEQSDEGSVHFNNLPEGLGSLQIDLDFKARWMGGTCSMNIVFSRQVDQAGSGCLKFKGSRNGQFTGKTQGVFCADLLTALDADTELKQTLRSIDLESLTIYIENDCVKTTLTPYGGGMVYLIIPPMRTPIPLPPEQVAPIAQVLKKISSYME